MQNARAIDVLTKSLLGHEFQLTKEMKPFEVKDGVKESAPSSTDLRRKQGPEFWSEFKEVVETANGPGMDDRLETFKMLEDKNKELIAQRENLKLQLLARNSDTYIDSRIHELQEENEKAWETQMEDGKSKLEQMECQISELQDEIDSMESSLQQIQPPDRATILRENQKLRDVNMLREEEKRDLLAALDALRRKHTERTMNPNGSSQELEQLKLKRDRLKASLLEMEPSSDVEDAVLNEESSSLTKRLKVAQDTLLEEETKVTTLKNQMHKLVTVKATSQNVAAIILQVLYDHDGEWTKRDIQSEVARKAGVDESTVVRALYSLVASGLVHLDRSHVHGLVTSLLVYHYRIVARMAPSASIDMFVDAAACGDLDHVRDLLLSQNPRLTEEIINKVDKDGKSAFHYACLNDDSNLLEILLADERVNVHLTTRNGDTAMHMAALYSSLKTLALLHADKRVDINSQNQYGETPLHLCAGSGDKSASRTADVLLSYGAKLTITDKWGRGPKDVSHDNAESPTVETFNTYLNDRERCSQDEYDAVQKTTSNYREKHEKELASAMQSKDRPVALRISLGGLQGVQLKKTETVVKTMFKAEEGRVTGAVGTSDESDGRKALSKLIDFPGDYEAIKQQLESLDQINPGGADAYGLTALHKFASWNKTDYLELLLPHLSQAELNAQDPEGKTALHYAVEMASVAAIKVLVSAKVDMTIQDGKGRTVQDILDQATASGIIERIKNALVIS